MALFRTLPTPTNDLLPSLMVEVCLVLAPDANFFLNSHKQGLPCWRSLSFFLFAYCQPEEWPSKRHSGCTPFALGWTPRWSQILWWLATRATTSQSSWTAC